MIRRFLSSLLLVTICMTAAPLSVGAFDAFPQAACPPGSRQQKQGTAAVACVTPSGDPISGADCKINQPFPSDDCGILIKITRIVAYLAGAFAVIMILVGAVRFITSGTDVSTGSRTDTDVEDAKRTISSALIGLVVIILAQAIITFVVRRL